MNNDKFQELVLQQFQVMNKQFEIIDKRFDAIEKGQSRLETRMERLEKSQDILATEVVAVKAKTAEIDSKLTKLALHIETEIEPKVDALFDGQEQLTQQLGRIEEQVSKHDEYILKRIK